MSFPLAVPVGASHLLSPAAQRDAAETDVSVRAERARLAGNEWEFDYAALHSQAKAIKRLAGRTRRKEAPPLPLSPCSWRLLPCSAGTEGLHTLCPEPSRKPGAQPDLKAERREDGRDPQPASPGPAELPPPSPQQALPALPSALPVPCPSSLAIYITKQPLSGLYLAPWHRTACEMH